MKLIKRILSITLVLIMAFSVTACHKKDEIAVTVNGFEYTSAYYMCALINAYAEGQGEVQTALGDKFTADTDFFKQKIDGKKFDKWVKDRAIDILKEIGTYQKLCKDAKVELSDEQMTNAQNNAYMAWMYYGYGQLFEPNGVSFNTFLQYNVDLAYADRYFEYLYGEGGKKEISSADVEAKLYKDFLIADMIEVTFDKETDKEKEEIKAKLDGYLKDLQDGKKTFDEVYEDYNKTDEEDKKDEDTEDKDDEHDHDHDHEDAETDKEDEDTKEDDKLEPLDKHAQILGAKDTNYANEYFDQIAKLATNEVKLLTKENKAGYILVVKKDIKADPYYRENLDMTVRSLLKSEEYIKDTSKLFKDAKTEISKFAISQFKVKKIKEPEAAY